VTVAEQASFSGAALRLGISPSAVSQSIRALEKRLGVALFNRTTRSVSLTEAGEAYLARVAPAVRELQAASEEIGGDADRPSGCLRLNVPRSGYLTVLQPILRDFLAAYPDVSLDVAIDGALVDIVAAGFDAGIRFGDLVQKDMIGIRVGPPLHACLIASPAYLAAQGTPVHPRDLLHHDCIGFRPGGGGSIEKWEFEKDGEPLVLSVSGRLTFNDSAALTQAALDGLGISYMINGYVDRFLADGRLVRILADWSPPLAPLTLYYADRRRVPPKLRALLDYLQRHPWRGASAAPAFDAVS
jgi:DNA-binding transcriptional LysR family regulator